MRRGQKHESKCGKQNMLIEKQQTHQYLACHHVNSRWYHYCQFQSLSQQKCHLHTHDKCSLVVNNHTVASQIIFTDSWMQRQHDTNFVNRNWTWVCKGTTRDGKEPKILGFMFRLGYLMFGLWVLLEVGLCSVQVLVFGIGWIWFLHWCIYGLIDCWVQVVQH